MKIKKSFLSGVGVILVALGFCACENEWGKMDAEAGNQITPTKQVVATYDFEPSEADATGLASVEETNKVCEVVADDSLGSNVLHLDSAGHAKIANPLTAVKLQTGAAITFYVKVDSTELDRPLISFGTGSANAEQFYITPNGQVVYSKPGQLESLNLNENDPDTYKTGMLTTGEWHFVALQVTDDGYQFYVDGNKSLSGKQTSTSETDFQYATLLKFLNSAPYIYVGTNNVGDLHNGVRIDDLTIIRNEMEESDWNKKPGHDGGGDDMPEKYYVTVGSPDCTDGFWTTWSDYFTVPDGCTFHTQFINYTSGAANWDNWLLAVTSDADRNGTGYTEYEILRSDNYGWGTLHNADNLSSTYNWDTYTTYMNGAVVDLTVERSGTDVLITAKVTGSDGNNYTMTNTLNNVPAGNIRCFLTEEQAYLKIDPEQTWIGTQYGGGSYLVGAADCSAAWWTAFSEAYDFETGPSEDYPFVIHFINNNAGNGNNWNNWLFVCTSGGGAGNTEYLVMRSDAYGWGTYYADGTMEANFNWDTYVSDMHGAEVWLGLSHDDGVKMDARQKKADGTWFEPYTFTTTSISGKVGFFLTAELASLDIQDVAYYPYFDYISKFAE